MRLHVPILLSDFYCCCQCAGTYLEAALASGAAERERYEHELAVIYLLRVVAAQQAEQPQQAQQAAEGGAGADATRDAGEELRQLPEYRKLKELVGFHLVNPYKHKTFLCIILCSTSGIH